MKRIYNIYDFYPGLRQPDQMLIEKDAPILTDTTGSRNIIYGAKLFSSLVVNANVFGLLPKAPWDKSGYRVITAAATTGSVGIAEAGAIPATIKPTMLEVDVAPKLSAVSFDMSEMQMALEGKDDVVIWADIVEEMGKEFEKALNYDLTENVTTLASNDMESIDRVCSSYAEVTNCADVNAGDSDMYGVDRDADQTWNNANVIHNSNTDRTLQLDLIDQLISGCAPYWDDATMNNKVFVTGYDTLRRWEQLLQPLERMESVRVQMGINGIQTHPGGDGGITLNAYKGIPIVPSNNIQQDTISRIYLLDLNYIRIGILTPLQVTQSDDHQAIDKFVREGVIHMNAELVANKFPVHGKVRDLS